MPTPGLSAEKIAELQTIFELLSTGEVANRMPVPSAETIVECYERHLQQLKSESDKVSMETWEQLGRKIESGENPFSL